MRRSLRAETVTASGVYRREVARSLVWFEAPRLSKRYERKYVWPFVGAIVALCFPGALPALENRNRAQAERSALPVLGVLLLAYQSGQGPVKHRRACDRAWL